MESLPLQTMAKQIISTISINWLRKSSVRIMVYMERNRGQLTHSGSTEYPDVRVVAVVEPDSLANLVTVSAFYNVAAPAPQHQLPLLART